MSASRAGRDDLSAMIDEQEIARLCSELVQFKSENPPGDELAIAEYVAGLLRGFGLSVELIPHSATRASLVARLKGRGGVPALVYCGPLDVVPADPEQWVHDPFGGQVVGNKLYGRGSSDMKGGVAAMIAAAKAVALSRLSLRGDLILAFTAGEEVDAMGALAVARRPDLAPAQALLIAEPTDNDICVAEKGQFWLEISTYGTAAHGSMPHLGRNAIMMMVALLNELDRLESPHIPHPLLGSFTHSVDTIRGGVSTNIVPERCVATVDYRTVPGQNHHDLLQQVEALVADLAQRRDGFEAAVQILANLPPIATSAEEPEVQHFSDIVIVFNQE